MHLNKEQSRAPLSNQGFSLLELIVAMVMMMIMLSIGASNLKILNDNLQNGSSEMLGFVKQVRARAISTTSAYKMTAVNTSQVTTSYANSCSGSFTADPNLSQELPTNVEMTSSSWEVCFNSRGVADSSTVITMNDEKGREKSVEIFKGGAARIF